MGKNTIYNKTTSLNSFQIIRRLLLTILLFSFCSNLFSQVNDPSVDTTRNNNLLITDTTLTIDQDTTRVRTISKNTSSGTLSSKVDYNAEDSMVVDIIEKKVYLYGNAIVLYEDMEIKSGYIVIDMEEDLVYAKGLEDSSGNISQTPVFKDGGDVYEIEEIKYSLASKKARIKSVQTQQDEGYITGDTIKKQANDHIHIKGGTYTTCNLEHPHYAFYLSKMIVMPDDKIVTKEGYMGIEGVPTPLVLPFGWFPNSKSSSAGVIIPAPGYSTTQGFFLTNLGWYQPITIKKKKWNSDGTFTKVKYNDMLSTIFSGDIYSRGSFRIENITEYYFRYITRGRFSISYGENKLGSKNFNDFEKTTNFFLTWNHTQDNKFRPNSRFTSNVNFGRTENFRQDYNVNTDANQYLNNNFSSNITYFQKLGNYSPFSLNLNFRHSQNSNSKSMEFIFPELALNMARISPFKFMKKKDATGKKWFENFGLNYTLNARNTWKTSDTILFADKEVRSDLISQSLSNDLRYGLNQTAALVGSFKFGKKKFTFNPSVSARDILFFKEIEKTVATDSQGNDSVVTNTINNISHQFSVNFNANFTTKIAGLYVFKKGEAALQKLRHIMTPSVSFAYAPSVKSFSKEVTYIDSTTNTSVTETYNPYQDAVYSPVQPGHTGAINFGVVNSLEGKIRSKKDTVTGSKKIKLIDNFTVRTGYNFFADSLEWYDLTLAANTKLFEKIDVRYSSAYTPYAREEGRKINKTIWNESGNTKLMNFQNANLNISFNINNNKQKKEQTKTKKTIDFYLPYTLSVGYNLNLRPQYNPSTDSDSTVVTQAFTFNGSLDFSKNWSVRVRSGYDFVNQELTYTELFFTRDLHCWQLTFRWVPFGVRQSYHLTLKIKASQLSDLKLERKKPWFDN